MVVNYRPGGDMDNEAAQAEAASFGSSSIAVAADVSKRQDVEGMMEEIVKHFGRLDIAINNAGIEIKKPFLEITDEEWNKVIGVNLYGSYLVSQVAVRQMVKQGQGGKLIFISSVHEDIPFPEYTAYCASKGGVRMMMRNLAVELAQHKINVNNIAPAPSPRLSIRRCSMTHRNEERVANSVGAALAGQKKSLRWLFSRQRRSRICHRKHLLH